MSSDDQASGTDSVLAAVPLFSGRYVVDSTYAFRISAAAVRYRLLRPVRVVSSGIVLAGTIAVAIADFATTRGGILYLPIVYVALLVAFSYSMFSAVRRQVHRATQIGSVYSIDMYQDHFVLSDRLVTSDIRYELLERAWRFGDFVMVRRRNGTNPLLWPGAAFTDKSLEWFNSRLAQAGSEISNR